MHYIPDLQEMGMGAVESDVSSDEDQAKEIDARSTCESNLEGQSDADNSIYSSGPATTPLYDGSPMSVLQALVKYFRWFSEHPGISKEALSSMLSMQHSVVLPPGNQLPNSYDAALREIEPYLVQPEVHDVCPNDCVIFRGDHKDALQCPKCGAKRYISEQSSIPARRFTYLPLKPRLSRLFGTANMAQILQSHAVVRGSELDTMHDIHQSPAWKTAYEDGGLFNGDPRGISLALCTDGVNPFAHHRVSYSMWPIMLTLLNLPRKMRNRFGSVVLVGIVPGNGSQEAHNLNPYLDILVDELLELCNITLYDAYQKAPFPCKVELLLHVLDYPGISKVFSVVGSGGIQGCAFCDQPGEHDSNLQKTVYLRNRRFLPATSKLRKDKTKYVI